MSWGSIIGSVGSGIVNGGSSVVNSGGGGIDWSGAAKDFLSSSSGSGGFWNSVVNWGSKLLGGNGGSSGGNIYEGILSGLGGAASAYLSKDAVEEAGKQDRKSIDFKYALEDYYNQKNKVRKRAALDTYGQFSTLNRWAPNATPAPPIDMPSKPGY